MNHSAIYCCPFCGEDQAKVIEIDIGKHAVTCGHCGAIGPAGDTEAAISWNAAELQDKRITDPRAATQPLNQAAGWPAPAR